MSILFTPEEYKQLMENQPERDNNDNLENQQINPYTYYNTKMFQYNTIQDQSNIQKPSTTGIGNAKLNFLMSEYNQIKTQYEQRKKEELRYLNSNQFDTIFNDQFVYEKPVTDEVIQENLRQQYFKQFVSEPQLQQEKEESKKTILFNVIEHEEKNPQTQEMIEKQKKWLKELKSEVRQIQDENERLIKKTKNSYVCKNVELIKKMAPTIYNAFTVYYDDIFDLLMEDIIKEEAFFLETLEQKQMISAGYSDDDEEAEVDDKYKQTKQKDKTKGSNQGQSDDLDDDKKSVYSQKSGKSRKSRKSQNKKQKKEILPSTKTRELVAQQQIPYTMLKLINSLDDYGEDDDYYNK